MYSDRAFVIIVRPRSPFFPPTADGSGCQAAPGVIDLLPACRGELESTAYAHLLPRLDFPGRGKWQTGVSSQPENGPFLPVYPLPFHIFRLPVELLNLFLRGVDVGDINISRRSKGVPDHPAPVVYPFIMVLSVGAGCVYTIRWQLPVLCILHNAYTGQWPHPAVTRPSFQEGSYSLWLFHLHSAVKIQPFSSFPLSGIHCQGIFLVTPLEFQGKSINYFL